MPVPVASTGSWLIDNGARSATRQPPYLTGCHNTSLEIDMYAWVSVVFIRGLFEEDLSGSRTEGVEIVYSAS